MPPELHALSDSDAVGKMYALVQNGRVQEAADHLGKLERAAKESPEPETISAFVQARYRYLLDGRRWQEAAAAKPIFESAEELLALIHAQGVAAAFLGEADRAAGLTQVYRQTVSAMRLTRRHEVELHQLDAAVAMARGDADSVHSHMEDAVRLEKPWDHAGDLPVTPIPTHELYGEMLLRLGEAEAAERELVKALETRPHRPLAILGRARAAVALGDDDRAAVHFDSFLELWKDADPGLEALAEARRFLAAAGN